MTFQALEQPQVRCRFNLFASRLYFQARQRQCIDCSYLVWRMDVSAVKNKWFGDSHLKIRLWAFSKAAWRYCVLNCEWAVPATVKRLIVGVVCASVDICNEKRGALGIYTAPRGSRMMFAMMQRDTRDSQQSAIPSRV